MKVISQMKTITAFVFASFQKPFIYFIVLSLSKTQTFILKILLHFDINLVKYTFKLKVK